MRGSSAGLASASPPPPRLYVLDALFSSVVAAPLVVAYWRSVWELTGLYVCPRQPVLSACLSTAVGLGGHLCLALPQGALAGRLRPERGRLAFYALSRAYTACFAVACVNGWRGPWRLLEVYVTGAAPVAAAAAAAAAALAAMRALRNVAAPPFSLAVDRPEGYFEVVTMFRVEIGEKTSLYILDCLFSVLVIGTLVVFVWRGAWALIDIFLFPENEVWSAWGSLIVGYAAVAVAFMLQPAMRWLCDRVKGVARLLAADLFLLLSLVGTVNVWRGIWNLLNIYLLPDDLELSCWITHWICLIILILLGCSNSLLVRGVYIDAEEPAGQCVVFPCYYLRLIFQEQKLKKSGEQNKTELVSVKTLENNHVINIKEGEEVTK